MPFEIVHFRESEKILKEKRMVKDVKTTLEYVDDALYGCLDFLCQCYGLVLFMKQFI